jgi:hypothetical protein
MGVLRRQAAVTQTRGADGDEEAVLHVCRTTRLPDPPDPGRVLFPSVHKTETIGTSAMTGQLSTR